MKLSRKIFLSVLVLVLFFSFGCGKAEQSQPTGNLSKENADSGIIIPEESPALIGRVKEIVGNEVTIYKMERNSAKVAENKSNSNSDNANSSASGNEKSPKGGGGAPMKLTGETETFLIPVGTPIVQRQRGGSEPTTVDLSEIKADQLMSIWKEDDNIVLVQIMGIGGSRAGGNQGNNGGPGGPGGIPDGPGGPR